MENLGSPANRFGDAVGGDGHHHEFLNVDRVVGVLAPVDDVHHRHRQDAGARTANITVKLLSCGLCGGFGDCEGDAENGVSPKAALVGRAVHFDHRLVDHRLAGCVDAGQRLRDFAVHGGDGVQNALALVARLVAVAQLHRLMRAGGGAGGDGRAAEGAVFERHVDFHRRVAPAVENFAGVDVDDRAHGCSPVACSGFSPGVAARIGRGDEADKVMRRRR